MKLLPHWQERLERLPARALPESFSVVLPKSPDFFAAKTSFVDTAGTATAMAELIAQRPLSNIGFDTEFTYDRPPVIVKDRLVYDCRSIHPLLLSLCGVEPNGDGGWRLYRFVCDLRKAEVLPLVQEVLSRPIPFVGHFTQVELFCLWQLGLTEQRHLWDTWTFEKALQLGRHHKRYKLPAEAHEVDEARAGEEAEHEAEVRNDLVSVCNRYGVAHAFASHKEQLQRSFIEMKTDAAFTQDQIDYAAEDAVAAARLYLPQITAATQAGLHDHLVRVEMPWTTTNARIIWNGVRIDASAAGDVVQACATHADTLQADLRGQGLGNIKSHKQVKDFFSRLGLLELFKRGTGYSFEDRQLKQYEDRHSTIRQLSMARKVVRLQDGKLLTGEFVGADGRVHPEHRQLGADTGRNTMRNPNIGGIGRQLRPLVIPADGYLIGEVDLSQIEVGIAAVVYGDERLIDMFNLGDVYVEMARRYYADSLPPEAQRMAFDQFKNQYQYQRDRMKVFTLATIYSITEIGLALMLGISQVQARAEKSRFLDMFPQLAAAQRMAARLGAIRGYAEIVSGLRRHRGRTGKLTQWERNWMLNTPVQGAAAVVFKDAGNRLDRRYQHHGAKIILPMHDAIVFEAPREHFETVANITAEVLRGTVQEWFPILNPQVEINNSAPHCWNKGGHADSLRKWLEDPMSR